MISGRAAVIILAVGLALYILYITLFIGIEKLAKILGNIQIPLAILSAVFMVAAIVLHGLSWHMIIRSSENNSQNRSSMKSTISIMNIALLASYIIPIGAITEIARALLASRILLKQLAEITASIMIHRIFITSVPFLALSLLTLLRGGTKYIRMDAVNILIVFYIVLILIPNMLLVLAFTSRAIDRLIARFRKYLSYIVGQDITRFSDLYKASLKNAITSPYGVAGFIIAIVEWVFLSLVMFTIIASFKTINIELTDALYIALIIQMLWWILPLSFSGSLGVLDLIATMVYQTLGLEGELSAALVLIYRIILLSSLLLLMYPSLKIIGMNLEAFKDIYRETKEGYSGK